MRIGVFGHYGNGNLGDEAIIEAAISSARKILGANEVRLYSVVPSDSAARHKLDAYPIRSGSSPVLAGQSGALSSANYTYRPASSASTSTASEIHTGHSLKDTLKKSRLLRQCVNAIRYLVSVPKRILNEVLFLKDAYRSIESLDLMIIAGSNQYLDNFGGVMGFPYTLMKWAALCRLRNTKVVLLSIGAGPIDYPLSRMMVRWTIRRSVFHSYRDEGSLALIEGATAKLGGTVYPDLANNLEFPTLDADFNSSPAIVAINPMPVYGDYWFVQDPEKYRAYLSRLADLSVHLHRSGFVVRLFPTQFRDMDAVLDLVSLIREIDETAANSVEVCDAQVTQDVIRIIQDAHVIIPTRFHGAVLGVLAKRLVLAVCYQAKSAAVLAAAGMGRYGLMLDELQSETLIQAFDELWTKRHELIPAVSARSDRMRASLDEQYRRVLEIISG